MKALIFSLTHNYIALSDRDAIASGFERAGYEVTKTTLKDLGKAIHETPVEDYDIILFPPSFSAIFVSSGEHKTVFKELDRRARQNAMGLYMNDISLQIDPYVWDKSEGSGGKINFLDMRPMTVYGSFDDSFLYNDEAMGRVQTRYLSKMHNQSRFVALEWNILQHYTFDPTVPETEVLPDFDDRLDPIRYFYYGADKKMVRESLSQMGFGDDPSDAVSGNAAKGFPNLTNLTPAKRKHRTRGNWIKAAQKAEGVLVPYEPIKGEHQVTLRLMEALSFYPNNAVYDRRISPRIRRFAEDEDLWSQEAAGVVERIAGLDL